MKCRLDPWVGKIPWRRKWQHTPVFLPGKSHKWGSLVGYSSWGCKRVGHIFATKTTKTITTNSLFQRNILSFSSKAVCWTNILFWDSMKWRQSTWLLTRRAEMWEANHHFPPALILTKNLYSVVTDLNPLIFLEVSSPFWISWFHIFK